MMFLSPYANAVCNPMNVYNNRACHVLPPIPQPEGPMYWTQLPALQPTEPNNIVQPMLSPPLFNHPLVPIALTRVDLMDVEETGNWVHTFGNYKGWTEASKYGEQFKKNCIKGSTLQQLNHAMLEDNLAVKNLDHRKELIHTIQQLFNPGNTIITPMMKPMSTPVMSYMEIPSESGNGKVQNPESEFGSQFSNFLYSSNHSVRSETETVHSHFRASTPLTTRTELTSESGWSNAGPGGPTFRSSISVKSGQWSMNCGPGIAGEAMREQREKTMSIRSVRRSRYTKLELTLQPDQIIKDNPNICYIDTIKRRLKKFNFVAAEITALKDKPFTYLLRFSENETAYAVFHSAEELGFKLVKKWPTRPSPSRPIWYKNLANQKILSGKAFSGEIRGTLDAGKNVLINQVKGRRARIIEMKKGKPETIGWVSVHTPEGDELLKQLTEL